ncbi:hypothetical protein BKA62DRAFT_713324 [Auriculariales sp. MPI-PUGE-AT-0066]|nr:hypothetical protein BKA62DRAFT_713324 [Auriculariales sp. MPI-PUGE-AT-0066]
MLTLSLPTRREVTIVVVSLVLFFAYFNLGATDDSTRSQRRGGGSKNPLQTLRDKAYDLVLGPSGPDYSREFGARFAKQMETSLANTAHASRIISSLPVVPPMSSISTWWQIHFKNTTEFAEEFGSFAGRITGVTWMCTDDHKEVDKFTLMGMQRLHTSISDEPPRRLVFPRLPGPRLPPNLPSSLLNLAYPSLSVWMMSEWNDFGDIIKPWLYERVVLVSTGAAAATWGDAVSWAPPFFVPAPDSWWTDLRGRVYEGLIPDKTDRSVVTYYTAGRNGLRLSGAAREALIVGLERLHNDTGVEVNIVDPAVLSSKTLVERLALIARTTILLGTPSFALDDAFFLRPGTTLMEFFPPGVLLHEHSLPVKQLGIHYIAWWDDKAFDGDELPPATETMPYTANTTLGENVPLNVEMVLADISARVIGDL